MQTPASFNPMSAEAIVNALRGPQGIQLAGDLAYADFTGHHGGDYTKAGPAASGSMEMIKRLKSPDVNLSGVRLMPDSVWQAFQYRHANPPPVQLPPLGGPNMPRGGGGGFLPPKL